MSEPEEDFDDRNALYALYAATCFFAEMLADTMNVVGSSMY